MKAFTLEGIHKAECLLFPEDLERIAKEYAKTHEYEWVFYMMLFSSPNSGNMTDVYSAIKTYWDDPFVPHVLKEILSGN